MRSLMIVAGVLMLVSTTCKAADAICPVESKLQSYVGNISTAVNFVNRSTRLIKAFWINYQGQRVFYFDVPPGQSHRQQTFVTHPWVITDEADNCQSIYLPQTTETTYTIN